MRTIFPKFIFVALYLQSREAMGKHSHTIIKVRISPFFAGNEFSFKAILVRIVSHN